MTNPKKKEEVFEFVKMYWQQVLPKGKFRRKVWLIGDYEVGTTKPEPDVLNRQLSKIAYPKEKAVLREEYEALEEVAREMARILKKKERFKHDVNCRHKLYKLNELTDCDCGVTEENQVLSKHKALKGE